MIDLDVHLASIRLGDAGAFARWLAGAERPVRESLRSLAMHVDTESVLQEALLRSWQYAGRVEPDGKPNTLLRYAVRIARNVAISEMRKSRAKAVDPETLDSAADPSPSAPPDPILRRAIEDCRGALPQKPAMALAARIESGGADADEVLAERLGMRPNTFLQNFTRARKMLAECLEGKGVAL